jgi:hypothetical protein
MDLTTLTYIVVGLSFALYIGVAIWARAGSTKEFYVRVAVCIPSLTAWPRQQTGCLPLRSSPWQV